MPQFLPAVPIDCMDGQPLRFHKLAGGEFVLYSIGENRRDDGGDPSLPSDKTSTRMIWERKDVVWPAPASSEEVQAYRAKPN